MVVKLGGGLHRIKGIKDLALAATILCAHG